MSLSHRIISLPLSPLTTVANSVAVAPMQLAHRALLRNSASSSRISHPPAPHIIPLLPFLLTQAACYSQQYFRDTPPFNREKIPLEKKIESLEKQLEELFCSLHRSTTNDTEVNSLKARSSCICGQLRDAEYMLHSKSFSKLTPEDVYKLFGTGPLLPTLKALDFSTVPPLARDSPLTAMLQNINSNWQQQLRNSPAFEDWKEAPRTWLIKDVVFGTVDYFKTQHEDRRILVIGEGNVGGEYTHGPVDFLLTENQNFMLIIEAKKDDFAHGKARVLMEMYSIAERANCKNVFGLVSNAETWYPYMLKVDDKKFFTGKAITTDLYTEHNGVVENLHKIVHMVIFMLENINTDVNLSK